MKPARKTKDFSIESILSDTFMFIRNDRRETEFSHDAFQHIREDVQTEKCRNTGDIKLRINAGKDLVTRTKNSSKCMVEKLELRSIKNCKITEEETAWLRNITRMNGNAGEAKCCDVDLNKISEFDPEKKRGTRLKRNLNKNDRNPKQSDKNEAFKNVQITDQFGNNLEYADEILNITEKHVTDLNLESPTAYNEKERNVVKTNESVTEYKTNSKLNYGLLKINENSGKNEIINRQEENFISRRNLEQPMYKELSEDKGENLEMTKKLEWLQFTRYRPPKIPRKPKINRNKRKPSLHPRIPFSTFELDFLEKKFKNCAYLSRNDVLNISVTLQLPPSRVKIWFQNRRARERRSVYPNI